MAENSDESKSNENLGFELYPERRSEARSAPSMWKELREPAEFSKAQCEINVQRAFQNNPLLKILVGALKKAGCPFDLKRNIVCEDCSNVVQGGYDSEYNQIVICKNVSKARKHPESVLLHELIHMYDYCVNDLDFKNPEHLACTEIRAASMCHCSFLSSFLEGQSSLFDMKNTHQYCVKMRAAKSLEASRHMDFKTAVGYVMKVFDRCYNDMEPIGRKVRRKSKEPEMAYEEAKCFQISE